MKSPTLNGPFNPLIIKRMRELNIATVEDFARFAKIPRTTVNGLLRGRISPNGTWIKPSIDTLIALARALNRPTHELLYLLEPDAPGQLESPLPPNRLDVSILGLLGAGPGEAQERDGTISVDADFARGKDLVGYEIRGDSMAGGKRPIFSGDKVAVNRLDKGASGQVVAARLKDGSHVCKALKVDKFGRRLMSMNPLYTNNVPPIIADVMVDEIIGRVVLVQGPVDSAEV
jgi:repressor LexA